MDTLITGLAADGAVRVAAAETTVLVEEARRIHGTSPVASAALGRLLTGAVLLSKQLKNQEDSITLQMKGKGPIRGVTAVCSADAMVRGYVEEPFVDLPLNAQGKLDVGGAIGKGFLSIIKDMGLKDPYVGTIALVSGEIAEDISYYLAVSEQIPSVVALSVQVAPDPAGLAPFVISHAGGFMLQLLPGAPETLIGDLEQRVSFLPSLSKLLSAGATIENVVEDLLRDYGYERKARQPCGYRCVCSKERMERMLISLGKEELQDMIEEGKGAEVHCQFCNTKHFFTDVELNTLLRKIL